MLRRDELRIYFPDEVKILEAAGFTSDSDIGSLDRTDLQELFPGVKTLKMRHDLFNRIHQEPSAGRTSRTGAAEVKNEIQTLNPDAARALEGCWDYLELLDRTDLMELFPRVEELKWRKKIFEIIHPQMPVDDNKLPESKTDKFKNMFRGINRPYLHSREVWYQKLDSKKCLNVSNEVIRKVTSKIGVHFKETTKDYDVSILLCPVITRIGSDAEVAIASIEDDKPVILVFLIHSLKPQPVSLLKYSDDSKNIVLCVPLFHHETKWGLLRCKENDNAISKIEKKLLDYSKESR